MKILLASQSPRRKELLASLGFQFETVNIAVEEIFPEHLSTSKVAEFLSNLKANAYQNLREDELLLTADTVVVNENKILGKPKSEQEALEMILSLSGKNHQVYTAVTFKSLQKTFSFTDVANVIFDEITEEEAWFYIRNYNPLDKAGAYGIQEWLGMAKIRKIEGNFYTIMGLPTHIVYKELKGIEKLEDF